MHGLLSHKISWLKRHTICGDVSSQTCCTHLFILFMSIFFLKTWMSWHTQFVGTCPHDLVAHTFLFIRLCHIKWADGFNTQYLVICTDTMVACVWLFQLRRLLCRIEWADKVETPFFVPSSLHLVTPCRYFIPGTLLCQKLTDKVEIQFVKTGLSNSVAYSTYFFQGNFPRSRSWNTICGN